MKNLFIILLFALPALAQAQAPQCSYFLLFNWEGEHPELFKIKIENDHDRFMVKPKSKKFGGITHMGIWTNLNCNADPICSYQFDHPARHGLYALPSGFPQCAETASASAEHIYVRLCWIKREVVEKERKTIKIK